MTINAKLADPRIIVDMPSSQNPHYYSRYSLTLDEAKELYNALRSALDEAGQL